jgi:hypothetical protein
MKLQRSLFLAACLGLGACASTSLQNSATSASVPSDQITVQVVIASGGAWGASAQAREAMESLEGVDRMMMSGTRATLVLKDGAILSEFRVKKAIEGVGLTFESLDEVDVSPAGAAYVAKTPKFTWAKTAIEVRETLINEVAGVQDVFCGVETIIHMKSGSAAPSADVLEEIFGELKVAFEGIERDDSAVL